jgi:hypothetical protein
MLLIRFAGIGWCRLSDVRCDRDNVEIDGGGGGDQHAIGTGRQLHRGIFQVNHHLWRGSGVGFAQP